MGGAQIPEIVRRGFQELLETEVSTAIGAQRHVLCPECLLKNRLAAYSCHGRSRRMQFSRRLAFVAALAQLFGDDRGFSAASQAWFLLLAQKIHPCRLHRLTTRPERELAGGDPQALAMRLHNSADTAAAMALATGAQLAQPLGAVLRHLPPPVESA